MKSIESFQIYAEAFGRTDAVFFLSEGALRVGEMNSNAALRQAIATGTASAEEIAAAEAAGGSRASQNAAALDAMIEDIITHRREPMLIAGMFGQLWSVVTRAREMGLEGGDFHTDTVLATGGGTKGLVLPDDYQDQIDAFFASGRRWGSYGMTELNGACHQCEVGAYHVPPWIVLLVLDDGGEALVEPVNGRVTGRAGFLDTSLDGRWGGVITGDRVVVDLAACECGRAGPVIREVGRFSDLVGDDKINCAGTIDAYVRGVVGA